MRNEANQIGEKAKSRSRMMNLTTKAMEASVKLQAAANSMIMPVKPMRMILSGAEIALATLPVLPAAVVLSVALVPAKEVLYTLVMFNDCMNMSESPPSPMVLVTVL